MPTGTVFVRALAVAGVVLAVGASSAGQAQDATPQPARWHVHLAALEAGYGEAEETTALIDAELAAQDQACIESVAFITLGRNEQPYVAIVLRC
jgi:hypothetical protein